MLLFALLLRIIILVFWLFWHVQLLFDGEACKIFWKYWHRHWILTNATLRQGKGRPRIAIWILWLLEIAFYGNLSRNLKHAFMLHRQKPRHFNMLFKCGIANFIGSSDQIDHAGFIAFVEVFSGVLADDICGQIGCLMLPITHLHI